MLLLFLITLFLSAFFSGSETAFIASNRYKFYAHPQSTQFTIGTALFKNAQLFLTTTLVGNNVVMVTCSSLAVIVFSPIIDDLYVVLFTSVILFLFGEIFPKSVAAQIPNRLLKLNLQILRLFYVIFFPLVWCANNLTKMFFKLFKVSDTEPSLFSRMDIPVLVREYVASQKLDKNDHMLISRAVKLRDKRVIDVKIPRIDIVGVEIKETLENVIQLFETSGFSRLPVYRDTMDQIEGFYYVLDFYKSSLSFLPQMRDVLFVSENMAAIDALRKLQHEKKSIAIVIDEHGGTAGLLTVEDIVEKFVGAISDEFDLEENNVQIVKDQFILADGKTSIDELHEKYHIHLPEGDYVTVAGLIEDSLGRIPETGEEIIVNEFKLFVLEADDKRIIRVRIQKLEKINIKSKS